MIIHIKNMVSSRCTLKVKTEMERVGLIIENIQLGRVELSHPATDDQMEKLQNALSAAGLEVMGSKTFELVEQVIKTIKEMIDRSSNDQGKCHSEYLSDKLGRSYPYLAGIFTNATGISIGQYVINYRLERTKEMIRSNKLSLSEIAFKLNFSSIGHLSNQFKKATGISPSMYRRLATNESSDKLVQKKIVEKKTPYIHIPPTLRSILERNIAEFK